MRHLCPFLFLGLVTACLGTETGNPKGTETGNPKMQARIQTQAETTDAARVSIGDTGEIQVDHAWLWIEELRFVTKTDCEDENEDDADEDGGIAVVVDLVQGGTLERELLEVEYCELRLKIGPPVVAPMDAPDELVALSALFGGQLDDGRVWELSTSEDIGWRLEGLFNPLANTPDMALKFDVASWFDGVNLPNIDADEDGVLRIDDTSQSDMVDQVLDNLARSSALYALSAPENPLATPTD
jgi:hypothetical protein